MGPNKRPALKNHHQDQFLRPTHGTQLFYKTVAPNSGGEPWDPKLEFNFDTQPWNSSTEGYHKTQSVDPALEPNLGLHPEEPPWDQALETNIGSQYWKPTLGHINWTKHWDQNFGLNLGT